MLAIYNDSNAIKRGLVSNLGETNRTQELVEPEDGRSFYRKYLSYLNSELDEIQTKELSEIKRAKTLSHASEMMDSISSHVEQLNNTWTDYLKNYTCQKCGKTMYICNCKHNQNE